MRKSKASPKVSANSSVQCSWSSLFLASAMIGVAFFIPDFKFIPFPKELLLHQAFHELTDYTEDQGTATRKPLLDMQPPTTSLALLSPSQPPPSFSFPMSSLLVQNNLLFVSLLSPVSFTFHLLS